MSRLNNQILKKRAAQNRRELKYCLKRISGWNPRKLLKQMSRRHFCKTKDSKI